MSATAIVVGILGAIAGGVIAWGFARSSTNSDLARLRERVEQLKSRLDRVTSERNEKGERITALESKKSSLEAEKENLRERLEEERERIEGQQEQLQDQFENLANQILEEKSERFVEQNEENLSDLLDPLQERLESFKKTVEDTYEKGLKQRSQLGEKVQNLTELNQEISERAEDLANALEGESKTQGDWGEMILERILEESGLQEGREYVTQVSQKTRAGTRLRPDVVIQLPEERFLIVDSKVSITAYRRYVSADTEDEESKHLHDHLQSLRSHVGTLAEKRYGALFDERSPDFVLMFVPVEAAFALALQHDEGLYHDAFDREVIIVSPTTLQATIATISNIWRQERQNQNAREIAERGGRLYDKFVLFAEALEDVGKRLDQARQSYTTVRKRLVDGRGNLVRQVEMLRELGAENTKELSEDLKSEEALQEENDGEA